MENQLIFEQDTCDKIEVVDCSVCGKAPFNIFMEDAGPTRYLRCLSCRTIYASPRSTWASRYSWLKSDYGVSNEQKYNSQIRKPVLAMEASLIHKYQSSGKILDIGCSLGDFFEMFPSPTWERHGVELALSAAAFAREKFSAKVEVGTLKATNFPDNFFDVVTLIDMIYYIDNPKEDLREIFRITKIGGVLAIEMPGQSYMMIRLRGLVPLLFNRKWNLLQPSSTYINWYSPQGIERLLKEHGFNILDWKVLASPLQETGFRSFLTYGHLVVMEFLSRLSFSTLSFAPKYFCIARKVSMEATSGNA